MGCRIFTAIITPHLSSVKILSQLFFSTASARTVTLLSQDLSGLSGPLPLSPRLKDLCLCSLFLSLTRGPCCLHPILPAVVHFFIVLFSDKKTPDAPFAFCSSRHFHCHNFDLPKFTVTLLLSLFTDLVHNLFHSSLSLFFLLKESLTLAFNLSATSPSSLFHTSHPHPSSLQSLQSLLAIDCSSLAFKLSSAFFSIPKGTTSTQTISPSIFVSLLNSPPVCFFHQPEQ